ncbi:hydroxymethylglutaryl-CoA lyase [Denitratimonas sp. CY0512]|uniref:hydroxymethylglutaryl-CoA lyase n=1 Tax=Denitratimonas sp. CY0512 TaxID=3131940 RepID=UPI0030A8479E
MSSNDQIRIVEVGPRDGLQNESAQVPTATKIALIDRLSACGFLVVEATSFVSPKWIPQMADAAEVLAGITPREGVMHPVLVPNEKGLERALASGVRGIAVFTAASDAFNLKNTNIDVDGSLQRLTPVVARAREAGLWVRGYVSTVLGCPYQGAVPLADVVRVTAALHEMGCAEISLGDTIGVGTAKQAREMLQACASEVPMERLAVHFHDTYGQALANVFACLEAGVRVVDAAVAGLGGCPYAQGASGNLASEDLVWQLEGLGLRTGVDLDALCDTARWINAELSREPASKLARIPNERRFGRAH